MDISVTELRGEDEDKHFRREIDLLSRECYDFYREHRKNCPKQINQYNLFVKAVSGLFHIMQQMLVESEGGVYIEGFGYFGNVRVPTKKKRKIKSLLLKAKTQYTYIPYFFPDEPYKEWTMSGTFKLKARQKIWESKQKYKLRFDLAKTFTEAQSFAQKVYYDRKRHGRNR